MSAGPVFVLGGHQTDFARNWTGEGLGLVDLLAEAVPGALADAGVDAADVGSAHVANLAGELFCGQAHLGGFLPVVDPALDGVAATRHEAACASGGTAVLAAGADLESGRYDVALVVGVELMRNVSGATAAEHLGSAAWRGEEAADADFPWPALFSDLADAYAERWGLDPAHLGRIAEVNLDNARRNPRAQARDWRFPPEAFTADDDANPVVEGRLRKTDCGRITDGAAAVVLASPAYAERWATRHGRSLDDVPVLAGWGHRTATMRMDDKIRSAPPEGHLLPHLRGAVTDAYARAGIAGPDDVDVAEVHDCFTVTEYALIDHIGITEPGQAWQAVEKGTIDPDGSLPVNPSGGLIGLGHPVGATGVRMVLDATCQVTGTAGDYQVPGARTALTVNIGGSATTVVSFVVRPAG